MSKKSRREFIKTVGFGTAAFTLHGFSKNFRKEKETPNILLIYTDDQRFDTIQALNNPDIITPNINRLVKRGMSFTRAHIMGGTSGAVCIPSRAMLMTGKTLFHLEKNGSTIPKNHKILPEVLRQNGYTTFGTGKWHNGREAYARAFTDGGKIFFGGMSDHLKVPVYDFDPTGKYPPEKKYTGDKFSSELFSDEAVKFLQQYDSQKPFFLYLAYTAPHDPRMAPEEYVELYPPEKIKIPENFMPQHPFDNGEMKIRDEKLAPFPRTEKIVKKHIAEYCAMITHMDAQIGRVLDTLERMGKSENTIIVFAGDNGLAVGQHGLLGKQNIYEHSVRVPLIICSPGLLQNIKTDTLCYINDIFPTLCDLIGIKTPETVEGKSLLPVLKNQKIKIRNFLFFAYKNLQRGVRTDDNWKLIKYNAKGVQTTQLFNLNADPFELNNLADKAEYQDRINTLTELLKNHMKELDDPCDLDEPDWGIQGKK